MRRHALRIVRSSPTLKYAAKSAAAAVRAPRRLYWKARRKPLIERYIRDHEVRKLHLGSGELALGGWLNTDLDPTISTRLKSQTPVLYLDVTARFPLRADTFDYVYAEHVIEHISFDQGRTMLQECRRVLRQGGRIRLATPDLATLVDLYVQRGHPSDEQREYASWIAGAFLADGTRTHPAFTLNNAFRAWGHQFLYDEETLLASLVAAGFVDVRRVAFATSDDPNLDALEHHGHVVGRPDMNEFETMVLEAVKP